MTPETRAACDRITAFLHAFAELPDTRKDLGVPSRIAYIPTTENRLACWELNENDLHTVLAALDQQPAGIIHFPGDMSREDVDRLHRAWDTANGTGDFLRFARGQTSDE